MRILEIWQESYKTLFAILILECYVICYTKDCTSGCDTHDGVFSYLPNINEFPLSCSFELRAMNPKYRRELFNAAWK